MTAAMIFNRFKAIFPEYVPHVVRYKNSKNGGLDIWLDDGSILNFSIEYKGLTGNWVLKGSNRNES